MSSFYLDSIYNKKRPFVKIYWRKKVKFSAGGSKVKRECLIHVLDASKNDVVNKFSTNSWKVGT